MYENIPSRHRWVTIRGWEPLGNVCIGESCKQRAEPYTQLEGGTNGVEHGTWGFHYFTLSNLQKRAQAYWCTWSDDWSSYDYVKLVKIKIMIPPDQLHSWMISFDSYFETKTGFPLAPENTNEEEWVHPGIMINNPKTHMILPQNYCQKKRFYKFYLRPPPGWKGYQRFPDAMNYIMTHWCWTIFNLNQPFFDVCACNISAPSNKDSICQASSWWNKQNFFDKWVDRSKYDLCQTGQNADKTWGPFLPSQNCAHSAFSAYFLYKIYLKFAGTSLWRTVPRLFQRDGLVPQAPGLNKQPSTYSSYQERPQDEGDILPGDLDSDGFIKDGALRRIIESHHRAKRVPMEKRRRSKHLTHKLKHIINQLIG